MSADYLQYEFQRLNLLIHREILRLRAAYQLSLDEFRGLYVSDQQVDALLRNDSQSPEIVDPAELTRQADELRQAAQQIRDRDPRWSVLRTEFGLTTTDMDVTFLALALESHPKYETLYAYLNNDVTRKWPTCDLAMRLFADAAEEKIKLRQSLLPHSRLFRSGLLRPVAANDRIMSLASSFSLAPELYRFFLDFPAALGKVNDYLARIEPRTPWEQIFLPQRMRLQLERMPEALSRTTGCAEQPLIVFVTHYGMGAEQAAEAICTQLCRRLLYLSVDRSRVADESLLRTIRSALLEQRLDGTGIFVSEVGSLFGTEGGPTTEAFALVAALTDGRGPVFMAFDPHTRWRELLQGRRKVVFPLEEPDFEERRRLWTEFGGNSISEPDVEELANRFVLGPGQIRDAVVMAQDYHYLRLGNDGPLSAEDLLEGARAQSDQNLGKLASRVRGAHAWSDLILPPATLRQIKEVNAAIRFRHQVYSSWGFDQRLVSGRGLKVLFSGSAGTGKTMTAGIIARDLGLDLYKIDLSGIVSKFIGETEKNLDRIFRASQSGNAILFFDEADALFGKRSEVKDAHDRYANIEVAYLLQKMEDHDGVVILATNLSKNMDDAFSRRMHYVVEFPLPNAVHRERLWRGMFPPQAPLAPDVDFKFLSEQFPLPGGDIRNIVLSAAFLAAQDGTAIHMRHLVPALGRLMVKKGKLPSTTEFKQYHAWLSVAE